MGRGGSGGFPHVGLDKEQNISMRLAPKHFNVKKLWFGDPGVYPLFGTVSLAAIVCSGFVYHYFTGHTYQGGTNITVPAPLDGTLPLFCRGAARCCDVRNASWCSPSLHTAPLAASEHPTSEGDATYEGNATYGILTASGLKNTARGRQDVHR